MPHVGASPSPPRSRWTAAREGSYEPRRGQLHLLYVHPEFEAFEEYSGGPVGRWTLQVGRQAARHVEVAVLNKPGPRHPDVRIPDRGCVGTEAS